MLDRVTGQGASVRAAVPQAHEHADQLIAAHSHDDQDLNKIFRISGVRV